MARVLPVEDDQAVRSASEFALRRQAHLVSAAPTGEEGLVLVGEAAPDIVVPDVVPRLRLKVEDVPSSPVLVRTARGFGYRFGPL